MLIKFAVVVWTLVAIILNLCGVGTFASWDITARPWHWSCLCIFYWYVALIFILTFVKEYRLAKARAEWDNAPEWVKHFTKRP